MNKGIIWGVIIVVVIGAVILFSGNTTQAPNVHTTGGDVSNTQPVLPENGSVEPLVQDTSVVREFTVEGSPFKFSVTEMRVKLGETVKVIFKNVEGKHDWRVDEFGVATKIINAGEEDTVEFVVNKTGSFEYYCSVGEHRKLGMVGTLIVE